MSSIRHIVIVMLINGPAFHYYFGCYINLIYFLEDANNSLVYWAAEMTGKAHLKLVAFVVLLYYERWKYLLFVSVNVLMLAQFNYIFLYRSISICDFYCPLYL